MRIGSDWNHYAYRYLHGEEERDAEVRFDVERALMPAPDSHRTSVRVRLRGEGADFEDHLREILAEVDCWLVGVMRYAGLTAFVLQVEDTDAFEARRGELSHRAPHPVEFLHSEGWDFFEDRVCPSETDWRRITDREQLERLADGGVDLQAAVPVTHGFYGARRALEQLRDQIADDGFELSVLDGDRLEVVHAHPLHDISRVTVGLLRLGRRLGVAYDGWRPT